MSVHENNTRDIIPEQVLKTLSRLVLTLSAGLVAPATIADINGGVETRVQSILQDMNLEQKVGQMMQGEIKWVSPSDVTKYHLGSVLNGGGSFPGGKKKLFDR